MTRVNVASNRPYPPGMPVGPGDTIAGKYKVGRLVAVGGMGIVVEAEHLQLGQRVAIKVLLPSEAEEGAQSIPRFLREARAAAGLSSDHVVRIYDVGTLDSGLPFMVMELLSGQDLRSVVKRYGPLPIAQAVEVVLQAADAIGEAHRSGIVHRDLKPSNLFVTRRSDGKPLIKVLDFGISKASHDPLIEGTLTSSRAMIGSPLYMSPEQVRDAKSVDGRSDIWSLGIILHEILSGKPVFKGDSLPAICAAIAADPPASVRAQRPDVPAELEAVVMRCLEKDPARRYANIDEFRDALSPFVPSALGTATTLPAPAGGGEDPVLLRGIDSRSSPRIADADVATLAYQGPPSRTSPLTLQTIAPSQSNLGWIFGIGALVLMAVLAGTLVLVVTKRGSTAPTASASEPRAFGMVIESTPAGASVGEGDRVLGQTPFELRIPLESVREHARVFTLTLDGYEPYRIVQGTSSDDIRVHAALVAAAKKPEASAEPVESAAPIPTKPTSRVQTGSKPSTQTSAPVTSAKPSTDIRLSR